MSGWDGWATHYLDKGQEHRPDAAIIYDPENGAAWGKSGDIPLDECANMKSLDKKADGDLGSIKMNEKPVFFIRKTDEESPVSVFKEGCNSIVTMEGPPAPDGRKTRVAVLMKNCKPEPYLAKLSK